MAGGKKGKKPAAGEDEAGGSGAPRIERRLQIITARLLETMNTMQAMYDDLVALAPLDLEALAALNTTGATAPNNVGLGAAKDDDYGCPSEFRPGCVRRTGCDYDMARVRAVNEEQPMGYYDLRTKEIWMKDSKKGITPSRACPACHGHLTATAEPSAA